VTMARTEYQAQLDALRADVVAMSETVLERYEWALDAVETGDRDLAERVVDGDHEINRRYLDLEGECIDLFALQQPVASDLRFVASSFKILTDLERVGDLATNLADYADQTGTDRYPEVDVRAIGDVAGAMVRDAVVAYDDADVEACRAVAARDEELDERCAQAGQAVVTDLLQAEAGPDADAVLDDATRLMLVLRDLERVGDHAVNVCARTLYMVEQDDELIY